MDPPTQIWAHFQPYFQGRSPFQRVFFWDQVQWNDTPYFQGCKWAQIWVGGSIGEAYKAFVMTETPVRNPFQRVFVWDRFFVIFWFLTHPNGFNCIRRQLFYHKPAIGYDLGSFSWFSEFSEKGSLIFCLPFYKLYSATFMLMPWVTVHTNLKNSLYWVSRASETNKNEPWNMF